MATGGPGAFKNTLGACHGSRSVAWPGMRCRSEALLQSPPLRAGRHGRAGADAFRPLGYAHILFLDTLL